MGSESGAVQEVGRLDQQAVGFDGDDAPAVRSSTHEIAEPIALLGADEADTGDPSRRDGLWRHDGERGDEIGEVGHVDLDAPQRRVTASHDDGVVGAHRHEAAHRFEDSAKRTSPCSDWLPRPRHADRAADDRGCGQRVARRAGIGFDAELGGEVLAPARRS